MINSGECVKEGTKGCEEDDHCITMFGDGLLLNHTCVKPYHSVKVGEYESYFTLNFTFMFDSCQLLLGFKCARFCDSASVKKSLISSKILRFSSLVPTVIRFRKLVVRFCDSGLVRTAPCRVFSLLFSSFRGFESLLRIERVWVVHFNT